MAEPTTDERHAMDPNDMLDELLPEGWEHDGFGFDAVLICPCGDQIEMDGVCPQGCVSPILGLI